MDVVAEEITLAGKEECKNRTREEDDGQEKAIESCRDIITTDSQEENVDGGSKDAANTLQ